MDGLYYADGSFRSRDEIISDLATRETSVQFLTPIHHPPESFDWWHQRVTDSQEARREAVAIPEHVEIAIDTTRPVILSHIGDVHAGGQDVDYELFRHDVSVIRDHPQAYCIWYGDLVDAMFFNPGQHEHLLNIQEQIYYLQSAAKEMKGKVLAGFGGDHDCWASKMGPTMYQNWTREIGAHYLEGVSYITVHVGEQTYQEVGAHRHSGYSRFNESHASLRVQQDDSSDGGDLFVTAHTHTKAVNRQVLKSFGGGSRPVFYTSLGTYKETDRYSRKMGWHRKSREQRGGIHFVLWPDKKQIEAYSLIDDAVERVAPFM